MRLLKINEEEYYNLFRDESEEFENKIAAELKKLSIDELNSFSKEFDFNYKIIPLIAFDPKQIFKMHYPPEMQE